MRVVIVGGVADGMSSDTRLRRLDADVAQGVGGDGVDKRIDVLATAIRGGITAPELADLELAYAPPFDSAKDAKDPVNMLGYMAENLLSGHCEPIQWSEVTTFQEFGYELIDVRTKDEFDRGHMPGARSFPLDEIRERVDELTAKDLIVTCQVGVRGHSATLLLGELGFNVKNLDGGYQPWCTRPRRKQSTTAHSRQRREGRRDV